MITTSLHNRRIFFYLGVALTILFVVFIALAGLAYQRQMAEKQATTITDNIAKTLEISIEAQIDKIDLSLQTAADEISRQIASGHPNTQSISRFLQQQTERLPGVAYVRATNERGDIIYGPGVISPPVNQADRDFFKRQRDDRSLGLFVEKPLFARINQIWVWPFSRRINKPDGSFAGVVFASIKLSEFDKSFADIKLGTSSIIALRDSDMGLMVRYPPSNNKNIQVGDKRISSTFSAALLNNPDHGSYISDATTVDGISRTISYHRSAVQHGFTVIVGIANDVVLAEWRKQVWLIGGLVAIFALSMLIFAGMISREWRRQERDMALLNESQQALSIAKDTAERANHAKSEFLSSMSHELRTPMNAILGFGQLMQFDSNLSEENKENLHEIIKAGGHLLELINEVLDLSRIESGRLDLSLEAVEVGQVIDECLSLVSTLAEKQQVKIGYRTLKKYNVHADRTRLRQVLLNLLSNAIKYNRTGGKVHLEVQADGADILRILVTDTGTGISAENLDRLFMPFNRFVAENSTIEGTGIGLTITRRIMELMGGTVNVKSELGVGSTFWIELPLESEQESGQVSSVPEDTASTSNSSAAGTEIAQHTVLYIEDNPANLKLVVQILARRKHIHLLTAHTPELGIELARSRRPGLILLDINMPGLDGYQVLKVLQADDNLKAIPVVAITANAMPRDIERGIAAGFTDYLVKPLNISKFYDVIDKLLVKDASYEH